MIYLVPENKSSLGDDTFWTWLNREVPSRFDPPDRINPEDVVLQYAVMGLSRIDGGKKVALCWELYPEMQAAGLADNPDKIARMKQCAEASEIATVASPSQLEHFPGAVVMPIGVDTDLFRPRDKQQMRDKHGLQRDKKTGFWCGTRHSMKGFDRLQTFQAQHPHIQWVVVMKEQALPQAQLAELMSACDFILMTGRLRPFFMVEWEAMACDLEAIDISGLERDFAPAGRQGVIDHGWSRHQAKAEWMRLCGVH